MRETLLSILLIGAVIATPLAIGLAIVATSETAFFAIDAEDRAPIPYYEEEEERYLGYE